MALIEINFNPDRKQLRLFGVAGLAATMAVSAILYYFKDLDARYCLAISAVGVFIFVSSLLSAKLTRMIYVTLCVITMPIGVVMNFVVFSLVFFLLITPLGLIFKLCGRDILERRYRPDAESYWAAHKQPSRLKRYFNQF